MAFSNDAGGACPFRIDVDCGTEAGLRLEHSEGVMVKRQVIMPGCPGAGREEPLVERQIIRGLATEAQCARACEIFSLQRGRRKPVGLIEADQPVPGIHEPGAVLFQVLKPEPPRVDVRSIAIAEAGAEKKDRLVDTFDVVAQGPMGEAAEQRLRGVEPSMQGKIVLPNPAVDGRLCVSLADLRNSSD